MSDAWQEVLQKRISALETRKAVDEVHLDNLTQRLFAIEDTLKWMVRLVFGAVVLAGITFIVQGGMAP